MPDRAKTAFQTRYAAARGSQMLLRSRDFLTASIETKNLDLMDCGERGNNGENIFCSL